MSASSVCPIRVRLECFNQISSIVRNGELSEEEAEKFSYLEPHMLKALAKIAAEPVSSQTFRDSKIRELIGACCRYFSPDFG